MMWVVIECNKSQKYFVNANYMRSLKLKLSKINVVNIKGLDSAKMFTETTKHLFPNYCSDRQQCYSLKCVN